MNKPRVLLSGHLPPPLGGIATFCRTLLESPLRDTVDLRFVQTSSQTRDLAASGRATGANLVAGVRDVGRFVRALSAHRPAVAHICTAVGASFLKNSVCVLSARAARCRVVLHPHCSFARLYSGPRFWRWYCDRIFRLSSAVIVLSEEWSGLAARVPAARILRLPNAIDTAPYRKVAWRRSRPAAAGARILYLGHLAGVKGTDDLLGSFARLATGGVPVSLDLAGDFQAAGDEARLRAAAGRDFGPGKTVRLIPPVSGEEKLACFERADLFVFPSHFEGMPMAVLEAMAAGLPIVATAIGGLPELVADGVNGFLVPPRDPAALAAAMAKLVGDEGLRARMGEQSLERSKKHDIRPYVEELASLYNDVLGT
jgi:glycosyltransferase involved in cell wall biosynthesis